MKKKFETRLAYVREVSPDFYVEAMFDQNEGTIDFWLCRRGYGKKTYMYGVPSFKMVKETVEEAFAEIEGGFKRDFPIFAEGLLDSNEVLIEETWTVV